MALGEDESTQPEALTSYEISNIKLVDGGKGIVKSVATGGALDAIVLVLDSSKFPLCTSALSLYAHDTLAADLTYNATALFDGSTIANAVNSGVAGADAGLTMFLDGFTASDAHTGVATTADG